MGIGQRLPGVAARVAASAVAAALLAPPMARADTAPAAPPSPDYAQAAAWAAWPGRPSGADVVPPGLSAAPLPESQKVDLFFIHPTTYLVSSADNARYDEPGGTASRIDRGVLRFQASAFNACCRIYAPHYRQAALGAFMVRDDDRARAAYELAYSDVRRAFDYYLATENQGRPFLIASHSQGSLHAMRLLQERVAGQPLQQRLVAAYVVGFYVPQSIAHSGLAVCADARQNGCLVDWNTVKEGTSAEPRARLVWLDGAYRHAETQPMVCVNPLNWVPGGSAPAALNLGALPGVHGDALEPPIPGLTGARCDGAVLRVSIPLTQRRGFADLLTLSSGSYHVFDYNLFYTNIRVNAMERVMSWHARHDALPGGATAR
jgi:Protein of unknown function (DUF3089)